MAAVLVLAALAPAAHAGLSSWTPLVGLSATDNAHWIRDYQTGSIPTTIYAGSESDGAFKSVNNGLTWTACSSGFSSDHVSVYTMYTSGGKIWAGTDVGLYSAPDSNSSACSWSPVAQGSPQDPEHPTNLPGSVQAVISLTGGPMLAGGEDGVYSSGDGGNTWTPPAADDGMAASTSIWSFASFANFVWAATSNGIYRSSDQGSTWTLSSDGIPFDVILGIFQDSQNPLIYYAETGSSGVYRSIDGGTTWQSANGDPGGEQFGGSQTPIVRQMQEFSGKTQTRLYVATSDGLWVGTLPNVSIPGPISKSIEVPGQITWRPVTQAGLGNNVIIWALSSFTTIPGTLLAGTQSNGGYSLTFQPPLNDNAPQDLPSWLAASILQLTVGSQLVGTPGNWSGTPQIDYSYQWQRCSSSAAASCADIPNATDKVYTLVAADQGKYIRDVVSAANDFPSFSPVNTAKSALHGPIAAAIGPLPGDSQQSGPTIVDTTVNPDGEPTEGDTMTAPSSAQNPAGWLLVPAAQHIGYQWLRCDANGNSCTDLAGATQSTYVPTASDSELTLRVLVTGSNSSGATTLPVSGAEGPIIPLAAQQTSPPVLAGNPVVGSTLVGSVGTWASPSTYWARQWMQCAPNGSDCTPITGATSPDYTVRAEDAGMTIELEVTASVVPAGHLPLPVVADTQPSAVVSYPPGVNAPVATTTTTPPAAASPTTPIVATPTPSQGIVKATSALSVLSDLALRHHGKRGSISFVLSQRGSVTVLLQRVTRGHVFDGRCVTAGHKHTRGCNLFGTVLRIRRAGLRAGRVSIALPTKSHGAALRRGRYRLLVTPRDGAGRPGASHAIWLELAQ